MDEIKINYILTAHNVFNVSTRKIDKKGKGSTLLRLIKGGKVTEGKIKEMYKAAKKEMKGKEKYMDNAQNAQINEEMELTKKQIKVLNDKNRKLQAGLAKALEKIDQLENKVVHSNAQINAQLKQTNEQTNAQICALEEKMNKNEQTNAQKDGLFNCTNNTKLSQIDAQKVTEKESNVLPGGWRLFLRPSTVKGKTYKNWSASKYINGKQVFVYVGKDPGKAQEKIAKWLEKQERKVE